MREYDDKSKKDMWNTAQTNANRILIEKNGAKNQDMSGAL
jgi:hypothetical protein